MRLIDADELKKEISKRISKKIKWTMEPDVYSFRADEIVEMIDSVPALTNVDVIREFPIVETAEQLANTMEYAIDNAPTVDLPNYGGQVVPDVLQGWKYEERPHFNRGELEKALNYWYEHLERNNEEQNEAAWCAINAIRYCIENSSAYQE